MTVTRWLLGLAIAGLVGGGLYVAGYYYVTAELPWQQDQSAAEMILQGAGLPVTSAASPTQPPRPVPTGLGQNNASPADATTVAATDDTATPTTASPTAEATTGTASEQHGTVEQGTIHSTIMNGDMPFQIYLPPGYNDATNTRYPTTYLLHGAPGNFTDWNGPGGASAIADALISTGRIPPMILAMPEGITNFQRDSEWTNGTPPALQAESYLMLEVVPYIDAHYRTLADRDDRAVGGLSTGGYGGVNTALHHPEVFGMAFGLSGNYLAVKTLLGQTLFKDVDSVAYNSPMVYIDKMPNPEQLHIYLAVGTSDKLDNTLEETHRMEQKLVAHQVPHLVEYDEGAHSWQFWSVHLGRALSYFASVLPTT